MNIEIIRISQLLKASSLALAVLLFIAFGNAQTPPPTNQGDKTVPRETPATVTLPLTSPDGDDLIRPFDIIDIRIEDAPELSGTYRLNSKGNFTLPVVGIVEAGKKTTEALVTVIAEKLRADYLANPIIAVSIKQRYVPTKLTQTYFIQGSVRTPGPYQMEARPTLLKLITAAGGLADDYGSTAFVIRELKPSETSVGIATAGTITPLSTEETNNPPSSGTEKTVVVIKEASPEYEILKPNIINLMRGNLEQNILIQPGDIVYIPKGEIYFVAGEVKKPGSFPLTQGSTLREAILLAQGTTAEAAAAEGYIFRESQGGARQELKVNIAAVMQNKGPDMEILPNDIIMIPSQKKSLGRTMLKSLGSTIPGLLLRGLGIF